MIHFDKIVKKLINSSEDIFSLNDIWSIIDPDFSKWKSTYSTLIYKTIYRLKSNKIIISIKNWLYVINRWQNFNIDDYYWQIALKIIKSETQWDYFISSSKALEFHLKDYSIQNKLIVYTKYIQKTIIISPDFKIYFKTFSIPTLKNYSYSKLINENTSKITYNSLIFKISNLELSLLDSLIESHNNKINAYIIEKFLKKYKSLLNRDILGNLVKIKYITSINRLRSISQELHYEDLYLKCLDIIKVEWANCFLTIKK